MLFHLHPSLRLDARRATVFLLAAGAWMAAAPSAAGQQAEPAPRQAPPAEAAYELSTPDPTPALLNGDEIAREVAARYPPALRDAGVAGYARMWFRIRENGSVDPASIQVLQVTNAGLSGPAAAIARRMRFNPMQIGNRRIPIPKAFTLHFHPRPPAAPAEDTYEESALDEKPRPRNQYPVAQLLAAALPSGMTGDTRLRLRVGADGAVDSASVMVEEAPNPAFREPAVNAARKLRFTTPRVLGRPVKAWVTTVLQVGAPDEGTYELSAIEEKPRLRNGGEIAREIAARYPPALRDSAFSGDVEIRFRILENGTVDSATVEAVKATHPAFVQPAVEVARRMRFTPAKVGGRAVRSWVVLPIGFQVEKPAPAPADSSARAPAGTGG